MPLHNISGVILAGGRGRRMGNDSKPLQQLGQRSLIEWVVATAAPQVNHLLLSVNDDHEAYQFLRLPCVADFQHQYQGPMAGIAAAMQHLSAADEDAAQQQLLACFAADVPWFPKNLIAILYAQLKSTGSDMALAATGKQLQPLFSLWRLSLLPRISQAMEEGLFGPKLLLPRIKHSVVQLGTHGGRDFLNINTREELENAQKLVDSQRN